jgi:A/G-specific adenine glycosylase
MSGVLEVDTEFALRVVAWQALHGRNHLPWQQTRDPYRVWLSEIMLQQTQVSTVLDYYDRFLARFPDVAVLAHASQDEVMSLWSGLGYYSRARNLHRCAQIVIAVYGGAFPQQADQLASLPGIGRSTAGAIAAFCFSERVPILDANVRRVLTRFLGFAQDISSARNERLLWAQAEILLPEADLKNSMPRYTQGLMDLGASVCTPRAPLCEMCPVASSCVALTERNPERYPVKTRRLSRRSESWRLLLLQDLQGRIWLERRPSTGIWAGMHCVPILPDSTALATFLDNFGGPTQLTQDELQPFLHVLTHRDLHLHPVVVRGAFKDRLSDDGQWLAPNQWDGVGLPAPVRKLLKDVREKQQFC